MRPGRVRRGRSVRFSGRVLGYGVPRRGLPVTIMIREGRRVNDVETVRTDRRGRFRYRYPRWRGSTRTRVRFWARVHTDSRFPYERGASNVVARRVN